ncbi:type I-E CRISPR-associated protein Cas5/CasD [Piscinibacter sp.]|uniref:type I-E CRISPR-associated protein Cas5/CasD n=1 Tax=Piscinibacter sp. TaxID=1903157 RepID=UPI0039E5FD55
MADFLIFQLLGPFAAWGEPAVGEFRGTAELPSQSALLGLLGAALGLQREDEAAHTALREGYGFATALLAEGSLLRDYHTAQVPPRAALKGRPQATRRQELTVPRPELGTILSNRDYRQNGIWLVALQAREAAPHQLDELAAALRQPRYVLYLGRKSCPPAAPLWPQVVNAESVLAAMQTYASLREAARQRVAAAHGRVPLEDLPGLQRLAFDEHISAGVEADLSVQRKDRLIRRSGWQFGDRSERVALLPASQPLPGPEV